MTDNPSRLILEYRTPDHRFGMQVSVANAHDALAYHPDAIIVSHEDGTPFEGKEAAAEIREAKAEIREERAAEAEPMASDKSKKG